MNKLTPLQPNPPFPLYRYPTTERRKQTTKHINNHSPVESAQIMDEQKCQNGDIQQHQ